MTWSTGPDDTVPQPPWLATAPGGTPTELASPEVAALLARLDGLAERPLAEQVERLDGVRRGLDDVLARPARDPG